MSGIGRVLGASALGAVVTLVARTALDRVQPGGSDRWIRTNHRGEPITLMEGPAVAAGIAAAGLLAGSNRGAHRLAQGIAAAGAGAFGLYDDLEEDTSVRSKGLKGHLGAMAKGELTTGGLKVLGIGATAAVAAALSGESGRPRLFDFALNTVVIAGAANLMNLLDLRPGRALKVATAAGVGLTLAGVPAGAGVAASAGAAFPSDLGERSMLGDCGANALGALLGTAFVQRSGRGARCVGAAGIVGLTLLSEKVSFSKVIAENKYLNTIDMWGRRPVDVRPDTDPAEPVEDSESTVPAQDTEPASASPDSQL